ncbi:MAG: conjugal transfer protein TraF [Candidatus Woesearchaeota archaeon]
MYKINIQNKKQTMRFHLFLLLVISVFVMSACQSPTGNVTGNQQNDYNLTSLIETMEQNEDKVQVYYFYGETCPFCQQQRPVLEQLEQEYDIQVHWFEVYSSRENQQLWREVADIYQTQARGVPMTFIGDEYWSGFNNRVAQELEQKIRECLDVGCEDLLQQ